MRGLSELRSLVLPPLLLLGSTATAWGADWPQFRGPERDGISRETGLQRTWPAEGPPVLWSTEVAQGYSGAAILDGQVFFNDYDEAASEWLRAFIEAIESRNHAGRPIC